MEFIKSRKPGKEIKNYEEFVKLNPKNIYIEDAVDLYLVDANAIQNETQFNFAIEENECKFFEVVEEYYSEEVTEFADMLQQLKDDYDEDLDILENAERLYNKGWRIER